MNSMRETLRSIRTKHTTLQREIAIRDEVIHLLCYRWCIFNQEDAGHGRADIQADKLLDRARQGTLKQDRDLLPPNVRLWHQLYHAYYATPGRVSMTEAKPGPLPASVDATAAQAAKLVAEYWRAVPDFMKWCQERTGELPYMVTRAGRRIRSYR
jgi:hypothetical protein